MNFHFGYQFNPERSTLLPGVPTDLTVVKDSDTQATISWNAPIGGGVEPEEYEVSIDGVIYTARGTTYVYIDCPPNVAIDYKVRSVSAEDTRSAWTDIVTYTNVVFTAPTNLRVTSATDTSITLDWDAPTVSPFPIASYNIFADEVLIDSSATNSYVYNGVTPNVAIDYTVLAVDSEGTESPLSEILTYTNVVQDTNLIKNGDFANGDTDWDLTNSAVVTNETLVFTNPTTAYGTFALQSIPEFIDEETYRVIFTLIRTTGAIRITIGGTVQSGDYSSSGTYEVDLVFPIGGVKEFSIVNRASPTDIILDDISMTQLP